MNYIPYTKQSEKQELIKENQEKLTQLRFTPDNKGYIFSLNNEQFTFIDTKRHEYFNIPLYYIITNKGIISLDKITSGDFKWL